MLHAGAAAVAVRVIGNMWETAFTDKRLEVANLIRDYVKSSRHPDHATLARDLPDHTVEIQQAVRSVEDPAVIQNRAEQLLTAAKRRLLASTAETCDSASGGNTDVDIAINWTFGELAKIYSGGASFDGQDWAKDLREDIDSRDSSTIMGPPTGMALIDSATLGLAFEEITVLAARTSHGKSTLSNNMIAPAAARAGFPVLIISHEMSSKQVRLGMACSDAKIDCNHARSNSLRLKTRERLDQSIDTIYALPIEVLQPSSGDPAELMAHVMAWRHTQGRPGLVIVDNLQNEFIPGFRGQRPEMFAQMSTQWQTCMKATGCAGLIVCQLNRSAAGQPPKLENLRDSGAIEQDAYAVMLLYRAGHDDPEKPANCAQVGLAKNRGGNLAYEYLNFEGYCMRFRAWEPSDQEKTRTEMAQSEKTIRENQQKQET